MAECVCVPCSHVKYHPKLDSAVHILRQGFIWHKNLGGGPGGGGGGGGGQVRYARQTGHLDGPRGWGCAPQKAKT